MYLNILVNRSTNSCILKEFCLIYPTASVQSAVYESAISILVVAVEPLQNGTPFSHSCKPGANVIAETIAPTNNIRAYMRRVDVEFLHDGQDEQHSEHAVPVQQQANYIKSELQTKKLSLLFIKVSQ